MWETYPIGVSDLYLTVYYSPQPPHGGWFISLDSGHSSTSGLLFWAGWKAPWRVMPLTSAVSVLNPLYADKTLVLTKVDRAGNLLVPLESRSTHSLLLAFETLFLYGSNVGVPTPLDLTL
ncbi:hypothetical protein SLA2020_264690 [Shorea laevis]